MLRFLENVACTVLDKVADSIEAAGPVVVRGIEHLESGIEYARENPMKATIGVATAAAAVGGALWAGKNTRTGTASELSLSGAIEGGKQKRDGSHDHRTNKGKDRTPAQKAADAAKTHQS